MVAKNINPRTITLTLNISHSLRITKKDIAELLNLPSTGQNLFILTSQHIITPPTRTRDFNHYFIMAMCSTGLASILKKDGDKKLWGYIDDHPD